MTGQITVMVIQTVLEAEVEAAPLTGQMVVAPVPLGHPVDIGQRIPQPRRRNYHILVVDMPTRATEISGRERQ